MTRGRASRGIAAAALLSLLAACAGTGPATTGGSATAGKGPPRGVYKVGNPYQIGGVWYYPKEDYEYRETGIASWYGSDFHGKATANGEVYDMNELTAAHRTLPLPSVVRVTNLDNGRSMTLRVNDRGPFARGRIIDISRRGAQLLGFERQGTAKVRVEIMAAESEQLAQIYRGSPNLAHALARTPSLPDPSAPAPIPPSVPMAVVAAVPPAPSPLPPLAGTDTVMTGVPLPAAAPTATIEQVPLPPPPGPNGMRPAPPPEPIPAAAAAAVDAPQPEVVTVEPVRRTQIYVQAGAFAQRANADRVRRTITGAGPVRVTTIEVSGAPVHRVRVGPLRSVEDADQTLTRVASAGYPDARIVVE